MLSVEPLPLFIGFPIDVFRQSIFRHGFSDHNPAIVLQGLHILSVRLGGESKLLRLGSGMTLEQCDICPELKKTTDYTILTKVCRIAQRRITVLRTLLYIGIMGNESLERGEVAVLYGKAQ